MKKIVFTGGHHNSALAVAMALKKEGYEVFWLGHKYSMWADKSPSAEYKEVTASGIPFYELKAGKFHRTYHPLKLARIPVGFIQAHKLLKEIKPDLIVSFGSYLAVPVVIAGFSMGIPSITHEQTSAAVISNQVISPFVKKIFLTFSSSKKFFPKRKTELIGMPLPEGMKKRLEKNAEKLESDKKVIFITGGKQGSHVINQAVLPIVMELVKNNKLIHQTGSSTLFNDFQDAQKLRQDLPLGSKDNYEVVDYLKEDDYSSTVFKSSLIVGRSGAHTVYQIGIVGKPSLWIPIPTRTKNEQQLNAEILANVGAAEILLEKDLTPGSLLNKIQSMIENIDSYERNAKNARALFPTTAKEKLVREIKTLLEKS